MSTTFFALFPPLIAIIISLITKKVNLSLFLGILVGVLLYCGFNPFRFFEVFFEILSDKAKDNMDVLIFIVLLGMIVHLIHLSGATDQYVKWAQKRIKSRKTTLLLTSLLGVFLFIDDYFNCMAIGAIMQIGAAVLSII